MMLDFMQLECLNRGEGPPEVLVARKELQDRDERIKSLEEAVRQRAEVQELMHAEHQVMMQQLEEARALLRRRIEQREKRRQARAAAAKDMEEQNAAKRLAGRANPGVLKSALCGHQGF